MFLWVGPFFPPVLWLLHPYAWFFIAFLLMFWLTVLVLCFARWLYFPFVGWSVYISASLVLVFMDLIPSFALDFGSNSKAASLDLCLICRLSCWPLRWRWLWRSLEAWFHLKTLINCMSFAEIRCAVLLWMRCYSPESWDNCFSEVDCRV